QDSVPVSLEAGPQRIRRLGPGPRSRAFGACRPGRQGDLLDPLPLFPAGEPDPSRQGSRAGMGEADVNPVNASPVAVLGAGPPLPSFGRRRLTRHATTVSTPCDEITPTRRPPADLNRPAPGPSR